LPVSTAEQAFADLNGEAAGPAHSLSHPEQVYAQVGGRATEASLIELRQSILTLAEQAGFPTQPVGPQLRVAFDRAAASAITQSMDMAWSEAASRDVWSFTSLVLLPDVTEWRWAHTLPKRNRERWVASDLTRHTWARLWWQAQTFADDPALLSVFNESELNQFLERRSIGGHPRLLLALCTEIAAAIDDGAPRRPLIRDTTRRLRRRLAFIDDLALDESQLRTLAAQGVSETRDELASVTEDQLAFAGLDGSEPEDVE
jgi:hypothetical protein